MFNREKMFVYILAVVFILLGLRAFYEQSHPLVLQGKKAKLIAIPATSKDIQGPVSYLFGRAPFFILYDRSTKTYKAVANKYMDGMHAAGLKSSRMLVEMKVDAVCGNNIGFEPSRVFQAANIEVYTDIKPTALETLMAFPDGLTKIDKQTVPAHFGITGSKTPTTCNLFDAQSNLAQVVQGKFYVCYDCGFRVSETTLAGIIPTICPKCGKPIHEVIAVAAPVQALSGKIKVKVV